MATAIAFATDEGRGGRYGNGSAGVMERIRRAAGQGRPSRVEGKASGEGVTNETTMGDEASPSRMVYGSQRAVCGRLACP